MALIIETQAEHQLFICGETPEELIKQHTEAGRAFDNFMWNYVGDPFLDRFPKINRTHPLAGELTYDRRILSYLYSQEGSLVHIRQTTTPNQDYPEVDYFVVSDHLQRGSPVEWQALAATFSGQGDNLALELTLRHESRVASLFMDSHNFMWDMGEGNKPETLLPGTELSSKLQNLLPV